MPKLTNIKTTDSAKWYDVTGDTYGFTLCLSTAPAVASGATFSNRDGRAAFDRWPTNNAIPRPRIAFTHANTMDPNVIIAHVGTKDSPDAVGAVKVQRRVLGGWIVGVQQGADHETRFTTCLRSDLKSRRYLDWWTAMAFGLEMLLVPAASAARAEDQAMVEAHKAAHRANQRARDLESVRERAAQGELQRLVDRRAEYARQLAAAARDLNLGQKDTAHGAVFTGRDWERMDSETLSMLRKELEAVTSALHEVQAYTRAIRKFEEDLTEANTDQAIRTMVSLQQARVAGEEVK